MPGEHVPVYLSVGNAERLYQGEVLSGLIERIAVRQSDASFDLREVEHPLAVIITQDCDLEQDDRARRSGKLGTPTNLEHVLLAVAADFEKARSNFAGSDVWKRARQNKDERFQFLSAVPQQHDALGIGIPSLVIDFKRIFSYPLDELLKSVAAGETARRARLNSPYVEHLASRVGYFLQRVALPVDHYDVGQRTSPPTLGDGASRQGDASAEQPQPSAIIQVASVSSEAPPSAGSNNDDSA